MAGIALTISSMSPTTAAFANDNACNEDNILTNSSFEEPIVTNGANWDIFGPTGFIPGWQADWRSDVPTVWNDFQRPAPQIELQNGVNGWTAKEGNQWTELDTDWVGPGGPLNGEPASIQLWQDITTVPGSNYEIRFWTSPRPGVGAADNTTETKWGDTILDTITENGTANANTVWTEHIYTAAAVGATTRLMFTDLGIANSLGGFVDKVSVARVCEPPTPEIPCDFGEQTGWYGEYFNYSRNHPDMNLNPSLWPDKTHGDPMGDVAPWTADWYTQPYFRFWQVDANLAFGGNFFPFDPPKDEEIDNGHDYHFGAHWTSKVTVPTDGDYDFTLRTDDDAWLYLDGELIADNSGIHPPVTINGTLALTTTPKILDIYFAERHVVQSHMYFAFTGDIQPQIVPYNRACPEPEPKDPPKVTLEKTGEYDQSNINSLGQITYELDWAITGEGSLDNVTITDPLPAGTQFVSASDGGTLETGDIVTWDLGPKSAGDFGTASFIVSLDAAFASAVVSTDQGLRKNSTPVIADRSHPENALGAPQSTGADFDAPGFPEDEWFYSLGFPTETKSASITLEFATPVFNGPGQDLRIFEVTYGPGTGYPMERITVEVSQDLATWIDLPGFVNRDGIVHLPADIPFIKYVRLTDASNVNLFEDTADGYDVDAVLALHPGVCEINNTATLTGGFQQTENTTIPVVANAEFLLTINQTACVPTVRIAKAGSYYSETNEITYTIDWSVGGKGTLYDIWVTDELPNGTTYVDGSASDPDAGGPLLPGALDGTTVEWFLDDQPAGASGTLTFQATVDSTEAWADRVASFRQGKRWNGTPVLAERSNPAKALGEAERNDTVNFVSLGFGEMVENTQYGELILEFDNYILNGAGADIEVVETSYGSPSDSAYPETVELFVSQNGSTWYSLGMGIQDEMFSFENGSTVLPWAKYVKLIDRSDKSEFSNSPETDGYDVDGVRAIYPGAEECSIDNTVLISGESTADELWQIVTPNIEAEATTTTEINPIACIPEEPQEPIAGTVMGIKFNDHDSDGVKDDNDGGLAGWKIYAGTLVDTVEVDAHSLREDGDGNAVPSNIVLDNFQKYILRTTGTFSAGDSITADAQYSTRSDPNIWTDLVENYGGWGVELLDLWIGSDFSLWGSFNPEHTYWHTEIGTGNTISLHIHDIFASNNVGELTVQIYEVLAETTTDEDGEYTLDLPAELEGEVIITEETQTGWTQTYPMPAGYHVVSADELTENINFGNHDILDQQEEGDDENGDDQEGDDDEDNDDGGVTGQGGGGSGGGGGGSIPPVTGPTGGSGDQGGVGGGEVAGDEENNTPGGGGQAGSGGGGAATGGGRQLALGPGGGDEGDLQDQGDILGDQTNNDDQTGNDTGGWGGWSVLGWILIPLLLLLILIYLIYRWLNHQKGNSGGSGV